MLTRIAACLTLAFICNVAAAQDVNQWARNLQGRLAALQGPIDEGEDDNRNQWGTGSVKNWLTRPGSVSVSTPVNGAGTIRYAFTGREKEQDYRLNVHQATHYNNRSGYVTARYEFSFAGRVYMTNVVKRGTSDRVGNGVVNAIRRQNGQVINTKAFLDAFDADLNKKGIEVTGDLQPTKIDEREETDAGTDE